MHDTSAQRKSIEDLEKELEETRYQLQEANEAIEAIRTGQVDALVVRSGNEHQLFTLKSADQTYRVFIEKMTEGAVTVSESGIILYSNSQFATLVAQPLSTVIGSPFSLLVAPESTELYERLFHEGWQTDCKGEVLLRSRLANIPVQLSLTTLQLDEGVSLSIIVTDLTLQKNTQRQLLQNNKQLEESNRALEASNHDLQQFASVASHDLQEPIRKIQVFSNLMKERGFGIPAEGIRYLDKIIDSSRRMRSLIIDILNYSRLSASEQPIECVDLNEIVRELLEDFELVIVEKKAEVVCTHLPCVDVNRGQMRQVFHNIISNALKFSKGGVPPIIRITAKRIAEKSFDSADAEFGAFFLISVRDNGIGFDEKYVNNIFSLFERLNAKDQFEGTGIGLAIAKKVIDKHGGLITAQSQPNEGASFDIILPVMQPGESRPDI